MERREASCPAMFWKSSERDSQRDEERGREGAEDQPPGGLGGGGAGTEPTEWPREPSKGVCLVRKLEFGLQSEAGLDRRDSILLRVRDAERTGLSVVCRGRFVSQDSISFIEPMFVFFPSIQFFMLLAVYFLKVEPASV